MLLIDNFTFLVSYYTVIFSQRCVCVCSCSRCRSGMCCNILQPATQHIQGQIPWIPLQVRVSFTLTLVNKNLIKSLQKLRLLLYLSNYRCQQQCWMCVGIVYVYTVFYSSDACVYVAQSSCLFLSHVIAAFGVVATVSFKDQSQTDTVCVVYVCLVCRVLLLLVCVAVLS